MLKNKVFLTLGTAAVVLLAPSLVRTADAKVSFLTAFVGRYPTATQLFTCGTCHDNFNGPSGGDLVAFLAAESEEGLNPFGRAFAEADGEDNPARALGAIENQDADDDGTTNIDEIVTGAGFFPGYDCSSYSETANAPTDLPFHVDPADVGCGMTSTTLPTTSSTVPDSSTTSSTITTSTTTSPTTSTTLLPVEGCAAPVSGGGLPSASDCLFILGAAVGTESCETECLCAPKGTLPISASDALMCLQAAVGQPVAMDCPCGSASTSTTSTSTTTSSTSTSSSTTSSSTTTTMQNAVNAGRATYDARCASCHKAGSHDTTGFASDIKGKSSLLTANLGSLDPLMSGITLSQPEITNLTAFLNSL